MRGLQDKVIVVIGGGTSTAGPGIGASCAIRAAEEGARVVVADVDADSVTRTVEAITGEALAMTVDVADEQAVNSLAVAVVQECGGLDGLFGLQLLKNPGCFVKADSFYHPPYGVSTLFFRRRLGPLPYPVRASGPRPKSARIDARSRLKYNLYGCDCAMRRRTVSIARIIRGDATKPVDRDADRRISGATG